MRPPPGGAGSSRGDTRGKAVPGKMCPCAGPFFRFSHTLDRGRYTPVGEGACAPSPVSLLSICRHPPPLPCIRRPSPPPARGGGSRGDTRGIAVPRKTSPCASPFFRFSHTLDRGRYTPVGEGAKALSPVSAFNMPASPTPPLSLCFQYAPTTNANVISRSGADSHRGRRAFLHRLYRSIHEPPRYR